MTRSTRTAPRIITPNKMTGVRVKNTRSRRWDLRLTKRQVLFICTLLVFLMFSGIGYVWSNLERTRVSYDLSELKRQELKLREINKKLRLELATLRSSQHLESVALTKLGLRQPTPAQIVVLP